MVPNVRYRIIRHVTDDELNGTAPRPAQCTRPNAIDPSTKRAASGHGAPSGSDTASGAVEQARGESPAPDRTRYGTITTERVRPLVGSGTPIQIKTQRTEPDPWCAAGRTPMY